MRVEVAGNVVERARGLAAARAMPTAAIDRVLAAADAASEAAHASAGAEVESLAQLYERSLASPSRRRSGSHYTTPGVAAHIADAALAPLFEAAEPPRALEVTICDPSMGGAACLLAAVRWLARRAVERGEAGDVREARSVIAGNVFGVDLDPAATAIARVSLWLEIADADAPIESWAERLRVGDGLAASEGGRFDVMLGNPPWISYVGRAAQPLADAVRARYAEQFAAFAGYRNLQGLFLEHAASQLQVGGRMAFLVPSSMSEQKGYAPTRRAVAAWVESDREMADVGEDAFAGVFQPCMIFSGTRRRDRSEGTEAAWRVRRTDLCPVGRALLDRLCALPSLPAALFGERGVQTSSADVADMVSEPDERRDWPLLTGTDIGAFRCGSPVWFAERGRFSKRYQTTQWGDVAFVVRQTAMFPIAAHARGHAFRNSLLAGFRSADGAWTADFLVGWLNAAPIRWLHFHRFRDARQGLPQVKIGHLRSVPQPVVATKMADIAGLAVRLGRENEGIATREQQMLDAMVADALGLSVEERAVVEKWARETPPPAPRRRAARGGST